MQRGILSKRVDFAVDFFARLLITLPATTLTRNYHNNHACKFNNMMFLILTQCFPPSVGGIESLMNGLARTLVAHGKVVVYADGHAYEGDLTAPFTVQRFGGFKPWRRRIKASAATKICRTENIHAIFCDSWKSAELLPATSAPITVLAHGTEYPIHPSAKKKRRITDTLNRVSHIFAVSRATSARVIDCGAPSDKISIVHPPLEKPTPPTAEESAIAAQLWGDSTPRILTVSRLAARKGVDMAIAVIAKLSADYPSIKYVIGGTGEEENNLREEVRKLGATKQIIFAGQINNGLKSALYASADIFLLPAKMCGNDMEGFGISFLEAAYFGLPSVAGTSGGTAESVEDGKTGLHCDGDDINSIYSALLRLLKNENLRGRLAATAAIKGQSELWKNRITDFL